MARRRRVGTAAAFVLGAGLLVFAATRVLPGTAAMQGQEEAATQAEEPAQPTGEDQTDPRDPGQTAEQAIVDHNTAPRGPRQPIPFSHRFHVRELQVDCMYCHVGTESSETGVVPAVEVCMGCHRTAGTGLEPIEELRGYADRGEPIPWVWVSKLPDFVQFPHRAHIRTGIACQECHGPVEDMARVYRPVRFTMGWCLDCHRSEPAETDVATDYLLVRENPPPEMPEGLQENSLYPFRLEHAYGKYRGPIDCLACHY